MALIQSKAGFFSTTIAGGDFGPGTRAMLKAAITFDAPTTAGSTLVVAVSGRVVSPGVNLWLGPTVAFVGASGGSLPAILYDFQFTFTDAAGFETMAGPITTLSANTGATLNASRPNPNLSTIPNAVSYSVYINGQLQQAGIAPNTDWSGVPTTGGAPPPSPVHDSSGADFTSGLLLWEDGGLGGTSNGEPAIGWFKAVGIPGGADTITFVCGAFNQNPFSAVNANLNIIALEYSALPTPTLVDAQVTRQGNSTSDLSVTVASSGYGSIITDYGSISQSAATVLDLLTVNGELFLTFLTGDGVSNPPTLSPPTVSAALSPLVYALVTNSLGDLAFPMWLYSLLAPVVLAITCGSPPDGQVGVSYTHAFPTVGGTPPYTYAITAGALPTGLLLGVTDGTVTGLPALPGTFPFTVQVTDSVEGTASVDCSITIDPAPLTISCNDPLTGTVGTPYSHFFLAAGGVTPYTWAITVGVLPTGLSLNASTGEAAGTPTIDGTYSFRVQVTDSADPTVSVHVDCSITIKGPGSVIVHYWEEVPEGVEPRLLMGTQSGLFVAVDDSNTDNGNDVRGVIRTPSYDMGDPRTLKLWMDAMTDVDATGGYGVFVGYNNYSTTPFGVGTGTLPGRAQYLSSLSTMPVDGLTLYRNVAFEYQIGVGTVLYEVEPSYFSQPFTSKLYTTQWLESGITGWKQLRYLRFAMISGATVQFQILNDDGVVIVNQVLASTGGRLVNFFGQLPHAAKGRMLRYTASSDSEFVLFVENTSVRIKKWGGQQFVDIRPFVQ